MAKKKETWESQTWEELETSLRKELNGTDPLEFVTNMLHRREKQRLGDKRRNLQRAAILEHMQKEDQAELREKILTEKGLV